MKLSHWLFALLIVQAGDGDRRPQPPAMRSLACSIVIAPSDTGSGRIGSFAVGQHGRMAWTEQRTPGVHVRDRGGTVRTFGRPGGGPGEILRFGGLGWIGDTLWVGDGSAVRVQFFTDTGQYLGGVRTTPMVNWAARPGGRLVGFAFLELGLLTSPLSVLALPAGAMKPDTLAAFERPAAEVVLVPSGARETPNPHPLVAGTVAAANPSHSRFCAAIPVEALASRVKCVDDFGRVLLDARLSLPARALTDAVYDSVVAGFSRAPGRTEAMMRDRIRRPRTLPQISGLMVTDAGEIWAARSHRFESVALWSRLRADGTVRDHVELPRAHRLLAVRDDSAWVTIPDSDDLESIAACRVVNAR